MADKTPMLPPSSQLTSSSPVPRAMLINVVSLSLSFLFCFTAFGGVQNLESSLDLGDVSGTIAVAIIYITMTIACFFGPALVQFLGNKAAILIQEILLGCFIASQIHPLVYTVYPVAGFVGIGASAMWTAQGDYVSFLAKKYADSKGLPEPSAQGLFQGIFFFIFQCAGVIGNLISSLVLGSGDSASSTTTTTLFTIYCICISVAVVVLVFGVKSKQVLEKFVASHGLDSYTKDLNDQDKPRSFGIFETLKLMVKPKMFFLIPLFIANGLENGFVCSDFTNSVVKPSIGVSNIGYVMAFFGGANAISSLVLGKASDTIGRPIVCLLGFLCNFGCAMYLKIGQVDTDAWVLIFVLAFFWAIGDSVWNTVVSAMLGACFEKEDVQAAFSNYKMWQSSGFAAAFFYSDYLDLDTKLLVLLCFLCAGIIGYFIDVFFFRLEKKNGE